MKITEKELLWLAVFAFALIAPLFIYWCRRGILPTQHAMVRMGPDNLADFILKVTPLGTSKTEVENDLTCKFRRNWTEIKSEGINAMQNKQFHVPISEGDFYLTSDFAVVGWFLPDVITVQFLLDREDKLKDVSVKKWQESA